MPGTRLNCFKFLSCRDKVFIECFTIYRHKHPGQQTSTICMKFHSPDQRRFIVVRKCFRGDVFWLREAKNFSNIFFFFMVVAQVIFFWPNYLFHSLESILSSPLWLAVYCHTTKSPNEPICLTIAVTRSAISAAVFRSLDRPPCLFV